MKKSIYTFGWPNVTVARDGIRAVKEDKCFGVKGLGEIAEKTGRRILELVREAAGILIKELAEQIGVTENAVINWEIRNIKPEGRNLERVKAF